MTTEKKANSTFIIKIVVLTVFGILSMTGILMSAIFAFASDDIKLEYIGLLLLSIAITVLIIWYGIKTNKNYMATKMLKIKEGDLQRIASWHIEKNLWGKFLVWKKQQNAATVKDTFKWTAGLTMPVVGFLVYDSMELWQTIAVAVGGGITLGLIFSTLTSWGSNNQLRNMSVSETGEIIFTEKNIMINDLVVIFNEMGTKLLSTRKYDDGDMGIIEWVVQTGYGNRKNEFVHHVPVPLGKEAEADSIVDLYNKLVK